MSTELVALEQMDETDEQTSSEQSVQQTEGMESTSVKAKKKGYKPSHPAYFASAMDAFGKGW